MGCDISCKIDNLHEMSKSIFWENKEIYFKVETICMQCQSLFSGKYFRMSSDVFFQHAKCLLKV